MDSIGRYVRQVQKKFEIIKKREARKSPTRSENEIQEAENSFKCERMTE